MTITMKSSKLAALLSATLLAAFVAYAGEPEQPKSKSVQAASEKAAAEETPAVSARPPAKPVRALYKPPKMGKPARTVGGGSRGTPNKVPKLFVVAPDHVGQTTSTEPSLYWYIDRVPDEAVGIEFTILDEESIDPLAETSLATPTRAGVQRVRLSDLGLALDAGTEYEWSIALVLNPDERSKDIVATGWIDRVEASSQLVARLEGGEGSESVVVYADEGIWYDAFSALSEQIDRHPGDAVLLEQRADLLRQVGLDEAARGTAH